MLIGVGKDGIVRLLNRDALGGHHGRPSSQRRGFDPAIQNVRLSGFTFGGPAYWEGPNGSSIIYTSVRDRMRQFRLGAGARATRLSPLKPSRHRRSSAPPA